MNKAQGIIETKVKVELTIRSDGRIWANDQNSGQCVMRIQGIGEGKIEQFNSNNRLIDLRIKDNEYIHLIVENEYENNKAHMFLVDHILYQGHEIKTSTRQLKRTIICDCGSSMEIKMKVADE